MTTQDIKKLIQSKIKNLSGKIGTEKPGEVETDAEWDARQAGYSAAINVLTALMVEIDRREAKEVTP